MSGSYVEYVVQLIKDAAFASTFLIFLSTMCHKLPAGVRTCRFMSQLESK